MEARERECFARRHLRRRSIPLESTRRCWTEVRAILTAAEAMDPNARRSLVPCRAHWRPEGRVRARSAGSDINFMTGTLTIARSIYETAGGGWGEKPTKTHQERRIGLDDVAVELMSGQREAVDKLAAELGLIVRDDGFVFSRSPVGAEPMRPDVVTKFTVRAAARAGGEDPPSHAPAFSAATQGIAAGYDPVTVAARHGHRDPSITMKIYSHVLEQRDRELATAVGRSLVLPEGSG